MQGFNYSTEQNKQEIEWRRKVESPMFFMLGFKAGHGAEVTGGTILGTEIEETLFTPDQDIDTRWEAFKDDVGWHVFLVAYFKDRDVKRLWHFDLAEPNKRARSVVALAVLIQWSGSWSLAQARDPIDFIKNIAQKKVMTLPDIVDLGGLKSILHQINKK